MSIITAILTFFSGWFARLLGAQAVRYVLWKGILLVLIMSVFPTMLYNLLSGLISEYYALISAQTSNFNAGVPLMLQVTGCAATLATALKIPESVSILISASMFRMSIALIPFVGRL